MENVDLKQNRKEMNVKGRFIGGTSERQDVNKSVMGG
jgi:hypothetical protein